MKKLPLLVALSLVLSSCVPALIGLGVCVAGVGAYVVVDGRDPAPSGSLPNPTDAGER